MHMICTYNNVLLGLPDPQCTTHVFSSISLVSSFLTLSFKWQKVLFKVFDDLLDNLIL